MAIVWNVSYRLGETPEVATPQSVIPELKLELKYDPQGKLLEAIHSVTTDDTTSDQQVMGISRAFLAPFWESLSFRYGISLDVRISDATRTDLAPSSGRPIRRITTCTGGVVVVRRIVFPSPSQLLVAPGRLTVWLHLANLGRDATNDADALRNYYMIIEDCFGRPTKDSPTDHLELKYARHFVSHGECLKDGDLLAFLTREFGYPVFQYDPTDARHRTFVCTWRESARAMVSSELEALLGELHA